MTLVFRDLNSDDGLAAADDVGDKGEDNEWCSDACCTWVGLDAIFAQILHMGWVGDNLMQNVATNQLSTAMHCFRKVLLLRCIFTVLYLHCTTFAFQLPLHRIASKCNLLHCALLHRITLSTTAGSKTKQKSCIFI